MHELHSKEQCISVLMIAQAEGDKDLSVVGIVSLCFG